MWVSRVTKIQKLPCNEESALTQAKKNEDITLKENGVNELMIQGLYLSNFEQEQKKKPQTQTYLYTRERRIGEKPGQ